MGRPAASSFVNWVELLDMEPLVMSIVLWWRVPDEALVEDTEMVLPRASVVVRSHCFASTALGREGGLAVGLAP